MYRVETDERAQEQVDALPAEALAYYAELRTVLELDPYSGAPLSKDNPEGGSSPSAGSADSHLPPSRR